MLLLICDEYEIDDEQQICDEYETDDEQQICDEYELCEKLVDEQKILHLLHQQIKDDLVQNEDMMI
jgi:hypothetical protein